MLISYNLVGYNNNVVATEVLNVTIEEVIAAYTAAATICDVVYIARVINGIPFRIDIKG